MNGWMDFLVFLPSKQKRQKYSSKFIQCCSISPYKVHNEETRRYLVLAQWSYVINHNVVVPCSSGSDSSSSVVVFLKLIPFLRVFTLKRLDKKIVESLGFFADKERKKERKKRKGKGKGRVTRKN
jgi:hypothetical protein